MCLVNRSVCFGALVASILLMTSQASAGDQVRDGVFIFSPTEQEHTLDAANP